MLLTPSPPLRPWEMPVAHSRLVVPTRLLPKHAPVVTRWVVLTGASCAGKTTLLCELEKAGFNVAHEVARTYVQEELGKGRTFSEVRANDRSFREQVFRRTLAKEIEMQFASHEIIFLDRSVIDSISVYRAAGFNPHEVVNHLEPYRYSEILHCNLLPFVNDGLRTLDEPRRLFLDAALERDYRALGYQPKRVPYGTVSERLHFVLKKSSFPESRRNA